MNNDLLQRKLHTLDGEELRVLRRIADDVFEPLVRPFRQTRSENRFDFRRTMRVAMKLGELIPCYTPEVREHRKSRLVIAMSLSGIDRCAAVSLIPLFSELKKHLDFRLFIYTDDLVEAEFTHDGYIANDIDIAWNNVAAPVVFRRLNDINFSKQEDTLLIIDNLGGGDSRWLWNYDYSDQKEIQDEQAKYLLSSDLPAGYFTKIREMLGGDFGKMSSIPASRIPLAWKKIVERNCEQRWVNTPAMQEYLVRWLFHPQFGRSKHAKYPVGWNDLTATEPLRALKSQFSTIHWMETAPNPDRNQWNTIRSLNVIDYKHDADTIEDFALVLSNIVHKRSTNKLTRESIKFADMIDELTDDIDKDQEGDHSELVEGHEGCFKKAVKPKNLLPEKTRWSKPYRKRGHTDVSNEEIPYGEVYIGSVFPLSHVPLFEMRPTMSQFSQLQEAQRVLDYIHKHKLVAVANSTFEHIVTEKRKTSIVSGDRANYKLHNTQELQPHLDDFLSLWSEDYQPFYDHLPITNVIWCGAGVYYDNYLGFTVARSNPDDWRKTTFHEAGHHMEFMCPQVGAFTNFLIKSKTGGLDRGKLVEVYGGKAMPVRDGTTPWITSYAGKWYERPHKDLPIITEIISVHAEYFRSPESLVALMLHDPLMVDFMSFVFMGGPLAVFNAKQISHRIEALAEIQQKRMRDAHGGYIPTGGRRGRPSGRNSGSSGRSVKTSKSGSYGV